jgi:hypothetical protein
VTYHRVMRSHWPAIAGATVAVAWLVAQLLDAGWLAAAVCSVAIPAAALPALARRPRRLPLAIALGSLSLAIALLLGALLLGLGATRPLALQLAFVVVVAPLAPLLYAATFPPDREPPP